MKALRFTMDGTMRLMEAHEGYGRSIRVEDSEGYFFDPESRVEIIDDPFFGWRLWGLLKPPSRIGVTVVNHDPTTLQMNRGHEHHYRGVLLGAKALNARLKEVNELAGEMADHATERGDGHSIVGVRGLNFAIMGLLIMAAILTVLVVGPHVPKYWSQLGGLTNPS